MKQKLIKVLKFVQAFFPTKLPVGMADFYLWAEDVISLSDLPVNDSTFFAVATMILHLPSTCNCKAKYYFVKALNKSAANQIAAGVMQDLKNKQAELAKAEQAAKESAVVV